MRILFDEQRIEQEVTRVAAEINRDYEGKYPLLVGILKGSVIFLARLMTQVKGDAAMDFMTVSSYHGGTTSGALKLVTELDTDPKGRHVIVVEDIVDTGHTVEFVRKYLKLKGAASVKIAALLYKGGKPDPAERPDYLGLDCPNEFVVGWGLDFDEKLRNLPGIYALEKDKGDY